MEVAGPVRERFQARRRRKREREELGEGEREARERASEGRENMRGRRGGIYRLTAELADAASRTEAALTTSVPSREEEERAVVKIV